MSRSFKNAELNYTTTEKELLSIIHCLKKFRIYLVGRKFTIVTDNKGLFLQKCHLTNARTTRWILPLQEYNFDIIHCKGRDNIVADTLSRNPEDIEDHTIDTTEDIQINHTNIRISDTVMKQLKNIGKIQLADAKLQQIIQIIMKGKTTKLGRRYLRHVIP